MEATRAGTPPAPDRTATVAPFRAWRGLRLVVAEEPTRATMETSVTGCRGAADGLRHPRIDDRRSSSRV